MHLLILLVALSIFGPAKTHHSDLRIVIHKHARALEVFSNDSLLHTCRIALGTNPVDAKRHTGDRCTPEGKYYVCEKNTKSNFHLSLGLSYPNIEDATRGLNNHLITKAQHRAIVSAIHHHRKPPWDTPLGGEIMIHGGGTGTDWTWGCIALENEDVDALFSEVPVGTIVEIQQ